MRFQLQTPNRNFHWYNSIPWIGIATICMVVFAISILRMPPTNRLPFPNEDESVANPFPSEETVANPSEHKEANSHTKLLPDDAAFQEALSVIIDKSLELKPREMKAYWTMVQAVRPQDWNELSSHAASAISISELFQHPENHRGEASSYEMTIRRVLQFESNPNSPDSVPLFEVWGSADHAKNWLFVLITPELPNGFTQRDLVGQKATFCGYFLKLQGYHPAKGKSSDRPLLAPLFVGKINAQSTHVSTQVAQIDNQSLLLFSAICIFFVITLGVTVFKQSNRYTRRHRARISSNSLAEDSVDFHLDFSQLNSNLSESEMAFQEPNHPRHDNQNIPQSI